MRAQLGNVDFTAVFFTCWMIWRMMKCHDHLWARLALNLIEFFVFCQISIDTYMKLKKKPLNTRSNMTPTFKPPNESIICQPCPKVVMRFYFVMLHHANVLGTGINQMVKILISFSNLNRNSKSLCFNEYGHAWVWPITYRLPLS